MFLTRFALTIDLLRRLFSAWCPKRCHLYRFRSNVSSGNLVWGPILVRCCSRREGKWNLPLVVIECIAFVSWMCLGSLCLCLLWSFRNLVFLPNLFELTVWLYYQDKAPKTRSLSITTSPYRLPVYPLCLRSLNVVWYWLIFCATKITAEFICSLMFTFWPTFLSRKHPGQMTYFAALVEDCLYM